MGSSAQILRPHKSEMTTGERVSEFLEIISPLGFQIKAEKNDRSVYMHPNGDDEKGVDLRVSREDHPIYTINGTDYYREVFFDFIWDDERYGPESMNSDMILAITAEYMKNTPMHYFSMKGAVIIICFWTRLILTSSHHSLSYLIGSVSSGHIFTLQG